MAEQLTPSSADADGKARAKKIRRPQQRASDTKDKILKVALAEFARHGFSGASTRSIAALAGVQHPIVNYHFGTKDGLWQAVLEATGGVFIEKFKARLEGLRGVDDTLKLKLVQEDFIRFSAQNPHFHMLMSQEANRSSRRLEWLTRELVRPYFSEIVRLVQSAQSRGEYVEGDPVHLQYLFIGAATRVFTLAAEVRQIGGRSPFSKAMVDEHVKVCLQLFFREPAKREAGT